jgi:hypothetical protein
VIDGHVHLTGGGDIVLAGDDATIVGAGDSCDILTNVDNTISGAGAIGDGTTDLALDNAHCGTIDANVSGKTLTIDTSHAVINQGTLEASNGGTLLIDDAVYNHGSGNALVEGGTINFAAAANVSEITFNNGSGTPAYGEVIFGDPTNCQHITVDGFTGTAPALCTSDAIDLAGTWTTSDCLVGNGGNLTITLTDTENSDTVTFTFDNFSGTLNVGSDGGTGTLITDPPANSSAQSATAGADSFVFNPNSGGATNNAGTQNDTGTHDHAGWAHSEDWAAIAGDLQSAAMANFALHNDAAHWHHDVPAAVHLH